MWQAAPQLAYLDQQGLGRKSSCIFFDSLVVAAEAPFTVPGFQKQSLVGQMAFHWIANIELFAGGLG